MEYPLSQFVLRRVIYVSKKYCETSFPLKDFMVS